MTPRIVAILAFAALCALGLYETRAIDENGPEPTEASGGAEEGGAAAVAGGPDVDRYCELKQQLDRAGADFFREQRDVSRQEFQRAGREFLREQAAPLEELQQVAPGGIQDDIRIFVQSARAFLGGAEAGPAPSRGRAAERRLASFDRKSCGP